MRTGEIEPQREHCVCAAMRMPKGEVILGRRHDNCIRRSVDLGYTRADVANAVQGFWTNEGNFVDRELGLAIQRASGFPSKYGTGGVYSGSILFSEDLY